MILPRNYLYFKITSNENTETISFNFTDLQTVFRHCVTSYTLNWSFKIFIDLNEVFEIISILSLNMNIIIPRQLQTYIFKTYFKFTDNFLKVW